MTRRTFALASAIAARRFVIDFPNLEAIWRGLRLKRATVVLGDVREASAKLEGIRSTSTQGVLVRFMGGGDQELPGLFANQVRTEQLIERALRTGPFEKSQDMASGVPQIVEYSALLDAERQCDFRNGKPLLAQYDRARGLSFRGPCFSAGKSAKWRISAKRAFLSRADALPCLPENVGGLRS
jgi:hypothetical protein